MLHNYFKIAWRNLLRRRFYAAVNIFGLSVGMTFAFLIFSYVYGELRVNMDLRNAGAQYMLTSKWKKADMGLNITTPAPLGKSLKDNYPNLVANYYRFDGVSATVSKGEQHFKESIQIGDSTLLTMYGFPLLHGHAATALVKPNSLVIPYEKAMKYFGKTDVVGQTLLLDSFSGKKSEFMITAVLDKLPYNSVSNLTGNEQSIFMSPDGMQFFGRGEFGNWANIYIVNFIELKQGVRQEALAKPVLQLLRTNTSELIQKNLKVELVPLKNLYREANNGVVQKTVLTLTTISLFILLMAIVNFVNISIGSSSSRLKEIGIRKVLGSMKGQVIRQFLAESVLLTFISMIISLFLYEIFRSYFGAVLGKVLPSIFQLPAYTFLFPFALALVTGLLAGFYPAFILSSLQSVDSMKGKIKSIRENLFFRRLLISSQFSIALFVIISSAVISRQVNYFFDKDLGYNDEFIFSVTTPRDWSPQGVQKMEAVRKEMLQLPEVSNAAVSYEIPNGKTGFSAALYKAGQDSTQAIYLPVLQTDENFAGTYSIPMIAGHFFQSEQQTYVPGRIVINEEAVKKLGLESATSAVGQQLRFQGAAQVFTVAGVVKNFHFESMHQSMRPLAFQQLQAFNNYRYISFRIRPGNIGPSLAAIENMWKQLLPDTPFEYTFMDDTLHNLYQSEVRLKKASQLATALAIAIVVLGILGMISISVAKRTREVGIRKVLGASVSEIMIIFVREFIFLMAVAICISFPLAFLSMDKWLQNYSYRIEMDWATFAWTGLAFGLSITALICLQTYKTALMNPVKAISGD